MSVVKGINWFPERFMEIGYHTYSIVDASGHTRRVSRRAAARFLRDRRNNSDRTVGFILVRRWVSHEVYACAWCGSRPANVEWDIEGLVTTFCDSPQCKGPKA